MKTRKILDIHHNGSHVICTFVTSPTEANPYRLHLVYWDGDRYRRRQIAKYADFHSILYWLNQNAAMFGT